MYPEWANIRIALSGEVRIQIGDTVASSPECMSVITGPTTHSFKVRVRPPAATVNVGLLPTGWARFIKRSAALHADRVDPLTSVFPDHADALRQSLIEAPDDAAACGVLDRFFLSLEPPDEPISPMLARAYELILDPEIQNVDQFAAALGRSGRQLSRLTRDMFGFSPKTLLRRQRFMRSLVALHDNPGQPWSALIDDNYYDHSHFVRDFHQFMDMSPTQFQAMPRVDVDRVSYVRARQFGVPHRTLQIGLPLNRPVMEKP